MRPALCKVAELLLLLVSKLLDDDTNSSAVHRFSCLACGDDGIHTALTDLGTDVPLSTKPQLYILQFQITAMKQEPRNKSGNICIAKKAGALTPSV
jgi:hypothetical protein